MSELADISEAFLYQNGRLPDKIDQHTYDIIEYARGVEEISRKAINTEERKMWTDQIARDLLEYFKGKKKGHKHLHNLKYIAYSAHESNVIPFMVALGLTSADCQLKKLLQLQNMTEEEIKVYNLKKRLSNEKKEEVPLIDGVCLKNPPFASNLLFELSHSQKYDEYFIKLTLNGQIVRTSLVCGDQMMIEGYCRYNDFILAYKDRFIFDGTTI